jgi:hypothetical protein
VRADLATASRGVAESDVELALGVGRRRVVVVLVGGSTGVDRRDVDRARGVREELVVRSADVDAEREGLVQLGYGKGKDSDRAAWTGLSAINARLSPGVLHGRITAFRRRGSRFRSGGDGGCGCGSGLG